MHQNKIVRLIYELAPNIQHLQFILFMEFWSVCMIALVLQIVTGIVLVMHYTPHIDYAFYSVEHIMRDISYGWLTLCACNGASIFFIVVFYAHVMRGLYTVHIYLQGNGCGVLVFDTFTYDYYSILRLYYLGDK